MALRLDELAKTIDHTLPAPAVSSEAVELLCTEALRFHFASVCVLPAHVALAAERLRGHDVKVCAVVGYPLGADSTKAKITAAELCLRAGADELEIVMNVAAMLSGDVRSVRDELLAIGRTVRGKVTGGRNSSALLKVVIESPLLDDKRKALACKILETAEADFVQTSTGFGSDGTTASDVELLRDCLSESVGVKASGGIGTAEDVYAMLNAGAARIGTAAAVSIMNGLTAREPI